jgi:hypothetical protein
VGSGATGAVPSATGSVGALAGASDGSAVGSEGGVAAAFGALGAGSWIIFSSSFLMSVVSNADFRPDVVSSNCCFRSVISASRIASWNWP